MKQLSFLLTLFLFASCDKHFKEKELYGCYSPVGYKNNFDTIELKPQGIYHRKVYDKDNKLILEINGKWSLLQNVRINLSPFYRNLDDDLLKFPHLANDTSGAGTPTLEIQNGTIQFCVGYYQGENCYQKIK